LDKIIVTVMLIIGGVVASFAIFNGIYPAVQRSGAAIISASDTMNDRIQSDIRIIQVNVNATTADAWVKNVGSSEIDAVSNSDLFFGPEGDFSRIPFGNSTSPLPYWNYQLEGTDSQWRPTDTIDITIHLASLPTPDTYMLKVIIPNGIFDETTLGVD
jgi:archaeal flagellar protein FlaG